KKLKTLDLQQNRITDSGTSHLVQLRSLEHLTLSGTAITDAGVARLGSLPNLRTLVLDDTSITLASLYLLSAFPQLTEVTISERLGKAQILNWQRTHPKMRVVVDDGRRFIP